MTYPIIITCIGGGLSFQTLQLLIKSKVHKDLKIIGIDSSTENYAKFLCDHSYQVPNGLSKSYINEIIKIIKKHSVKLIIPCSDEEVFQLSKHISILKKLGTNVACPTANVFPIISNKIKTYKFMNELNINTPIWKHGNSKKSVIEAVENLFDLNLNNLIIKPAKGRGSKDVLTISKKNLNENTFFKNYTFSQFKKMIDKYILNQSYIISEKLNNPVYDLDFLSWKGKVLQSTFRQRIKGELPNEGHFIRKVPKELSKSINIISSKLNLSWLYDCDWMYDNDGILKIIELNPRMSGSIAVPVIAGANYLDNIISLSKNKRIIIKNAKRDLAIIPVKTLFKKEL
tara:strand:+ start:10844 stop:11872 length:1029 start_codon:yes stop_codon:yes gene_type:complete